jgi:predicted Co/Zn/Cd cation transporter (cation efflux family)
MAAPSADHERRVLTRSILVTALLGALGVAWGIAVGSQMILLDGVYAVIGIALSWLLLRASAIAEQGPTRNFPYGREAATPLVIGIQGFVLAGTLVYAAFEAITTIRLGGSEFTPGWAIVYGVLTTIASVVTWRWIHSTTADSDLLTAEATAWRIGALRGAGMVVGFTVMALLVGSRWDSTARYVDPIMVLITCVAFMPAPVQMMRTTVIELLEGSPPDEIRSAVQHGVDDVRTAFGLGELVVRTTKVGPKLYVEIDGVVDADVTVRREHEIRSALNARLDELPYEIWLNLELTPRPA